MIFTVFLNVVVVGCLVFLYINTKKKEKLKKLKNIK